MSEEPSSLARDANRIHQALKELLATHEPYDKEVEFQRKKLRRQYLQLLLVHPFAQESKDVENHLWMQSSYAFIAAYKQQINAVDRAIQNNARQQQQQQPPQQQQRHHAPGPVEYRKLLQRFRQFLAEEEKFWTKLVVRLYRAFGLEEAQSALVALGIQPADAQGASADTINNAPGRNQLLFPPESSTPPIGTRTPVERETSMSTLSKALVCLGDIARYRELYNESGGRPRAGHEDGIPARRRQRRGAFGTWVDNVPKARNYDKAQQCYEQARLLVPHEGNPSHQLAILASYKKDGYNSLFHYYRALCVKQPYDTALNNLGTLLAKSLDHWRVENRRDKNKNGPTDPNLHPRFRVDRFKERVVVLHALWRVGTERGIEKMNSISRRLDKDVADDFITLVGQRQMPADMITQVIVMSQGALWKHRMLRDSSAQEQQGGSSGSTLILEWCIVKHILDMHCALLEIGKDELKVPPSHDTKDDLGQQITATFRRTLPGLRVATKWLRANAKYLSQDPEFNAYQQKKQGATSAKPQRKMSGYSVHTRTFWEMFAEFSRALARAFPLAKLPKLTAPLEEDTELKGFLPLKNSMGNFITDNEGRVQPREEVHPNDEQLMRIADLLGDARAIAELEVGLVGKSGYVMFDTDGFEPEPAKGKDDTSGRQESIDRVSNLQQVTPPMQVPQPDPREKEPEDNLSDITSPDDDEDVVRDAFSHLDTGDQNEDDQEDEIVFNPRPAVSPIMAAAVSSPIQTSPMSPSRAMARPLSATKPSPCSPARTNGVLPTVVAPTTAEDLLNNVMGRGRSSGSLSAPQPPLLFRSELSHRSNQSIWSTSRDEQRMMASATGHMSGNPLFQSPTLQYSALTPASEPPAMVQQSIWSTSPPYITSNLETIQPNVPGNITGVGQALPPTTHPVQNYGLSPALGGANTINGSTSNLPQHQRVNSLTQQLQLQQLQQQQNQPLSYSFSGGSYGLNANSANFALSIHSNGISSLTGPFGGPTDTLYSSDYPSGLSSTPYHHSRHLSYNDSRVGQPMHHPPPPVWGNT
ncbi:hypothetical protein AMATHDRAFT_143301 [Amanita thiersii Skay4041]|uniref:DNA/RNA-binding domain-containing protein n=1 Tax=Amanita thiersii Skay4041 TaxID=703135 RepID=A0A2A9NTR4_9AGAR|nr:hypothetical protein AMATHDRAFT_143301 [Amanita thiersii Skay4041]